MKGDTRCVDGRLYRHSPQSDDPYLEMDVGECPECGGNGCADNQMRTAQAELTRLRADKAVLAGALKELLAAAELTNAAWDSDDAWRKYEAAVEQTRRVLAQHGRDV